MSHAPTKSSLVWLALVCATLGSGLLAERHGLGRWTFYWILLFALFKARLVLLHFMELASAPPALRITFELWIAACVVMIGALHWLGPI